MTATGGRRLDGDRRYYVRRGAPLRVVIDAQPYQLANWSLGGFVVVGYEGERQPGERFSAQLVGSPGEGAAAVAVTAVRHEAANGELALRFEHLDDAALDLLTRYS